MKAFHFALDRALHIRRIQLDVERTRLQTLVREGEQLELRASAIRSDATETRRALSQQPFFTPGEVSTVPDHQRGALRSLKKLESLKQDLSRRVADQQRLTWEAERKVKLLEKLRSRRFEQWNAELQKEQEDFAAGAYLARWVSASSQPVPPTG